MLRYRALLTAIPLALCLFFPARDARAVHKNWVMKNAGSDCTFNSPNPLVDNYFAYALYNSESFTRSVTCPVTLAARWGASGSQLVRWAGAWAANIYVHNASPGTAFSCSTRARMASGLTYFSRSVSTTSGGDQKLTPAFSGDWGGGLEPVETQTVRSMDFACSVPPNQSGIYGYRVRICQSTSASGPDCNDPMRPDGDAATVSDTTPGADWVQTSAHQCVATSSDVSRGFEGMKNLGTGHASVSCPLNVPADDSNEVYRKIQELNVFYKDPQQGSMTCQLSWNERNSTTWDEKWTAPLIQHTSDQLISLQPITVNREIAMAVLCDLPPGVTLQGITAKMFVAPVSGGG